MGGSSYSLAQMDTLSKNVWQRAVNLSYPATLTLKGKVNIEPMSIISVVIMTEDWNGTSFQWGQPI